MEKEQWPPREEFCTAGGWRQKMRSACHGVAEAWMGIDICLFFQFGQTKYFPPSHSVLHAPFFQWPIQNFLLERVIKLVFSTDRIF